MNRKLTLTIEKEVIEQMKRYAKAKEQSLSELVENYFKFLTKNAEAAPEKSMSKKVSSLRGVLKVNDDFLYKEILEDEILKKHGI